MSSLKESLAELLRTIEETGRELRRDLTSKRVARPMEELNPPVRQPRPPPWDDVWERRTNDWCLLLGSLLGAPVCGFFLALVSRPLGGLIGILGFFGFVIALARLSVFACPRCGRRFDTVVTARGSRWSNAFTRKCLFCGLRVGTRY